MSALRKILDAKRVVVCVGSGGVGKTTVAAGLALRAALLGRRTLVVTIDPARRLANSLGLDELGNVETKIDLEHFERAGLGPKGELWAMVLDVKRTSDELVARYASSPEQAERIYANRFYQTASTVLAGSHEYLAMEKLYALHGEERFDLIVLDTPPTAHALDFLDAPSRVLDLFDNDALKWIATPAVAAGAFGARALGVGGGYLVGQLSKFTGVETLRALAEFLISMQGMYEGFKERASKVSSLLASDETSFVLVTAPGSTEEAGYFRDALAASEMPLGAVVINRMHPDWMRASTAPLDGSALAERFARDLAERLLATVQELQVRAEADWREAESFASALEERGCIQHVPVFERDLHDLRGLELMGRCLFSDWGASTTDSETAPPERRSSQGGARPKGSGG